MMIDDLWIVKHRPTTLDEFVWRDPVMREKVEEWLASGRLPHLLFSGVSGTGKTSLAMLLLDLLNIPNDDRLIIPSSRDRGIDALQSKIIGFINAWALNDSGLKYILFDEADGLSATAQRMLRTESETYASSCRFILTCNYPNRILPALHGRLQEITFSALDRESFVMRAADVLMQEKVKFEEEDLMLYTDKTYPDLRKCLGMLEQNTIGGKLNPAREDDQAAKDYITGSIDLFRKGKYIEARKLIIEQADPEDYDSVYRFLYENLDLFGSSAKYQDEALKIIRNGLVNDSRVADREICLSACIAELTHVMIRDTLAVTDHISAELLRDKNGNIIST